MYCIKNRLSTGTKYVRSRAMGEHITYPVSSSNASVIREKTG